MNVFDKSDVIGNFHYPKPRAVGQQPMSDTTRPDVSVLHLILIRLFTHVKEPTTYKWSEIHVLPGKFLWVTLVSNPIILAIFSYVKKNLES